MFDKKLLQEYNKLSKINKNYNITKLYCLYCVDCALKWLKIQDTTNEETMLKMASITYDYYLDAEYIQISKISDIVCEHWNEIESGQDFDIYNYIEVF